jgi:hypothetical protein
VAHGSRLRRRAGFVASVLAMFLSPVLAGPTSVAAAEDALTPVVHDVLAGDLVMAGNSNLLSAGGYRAAPDAVADVDGDATALCVGRLYVPAACGENSSSAMPDIPFGGRVVAARLYVNTTLSNVVSPIRVRLDGPAPEYAYTELSAATPGIAKIRESTGTSSSAAVPMRQAVWDLTGYVQSAGGGIYTVADIMFERAGAYLPYASWTIVAAYELDPAADIAVMSPEQQARFARRAITWDDGFATITSGSVDIAVDGYDVPVGTSVFAKTFHLAAHARHRGPDSLLFAGQPVGNNASPGNAATPTGVFIGTDAACNSTTDVLNDSICVLGSPVATKSPGAADFVTSRDGRTPSSGSGVDFDVNRVPDRYLVAGTTAATLSLQSAGRSPIAVGMLAVSVDLPATPPDVSP